MVMIWLVFTLHSTQSGLLSPQSPGVGRGVRRTQLFGLACCGENLSGEIFGFSLPMNYGFLILNHQTIKYCKAEYKSPINYINFLAVDDDKVQYFGDQLPL